MPTAATARRTTRKTAKRASVRTATETSGRRATASARGKVRRTSQFARVNLRIHEIKCIKTTKEVDRDEIILAAIKVQGKVQGGSSKKKLAAKAEKGEVLDAGKFKKGASRKYRSPRVVARFAAGSGQAGWPRYYYATFLLIEKDEGAIGTIVNAAVRSVEKEVAEAVKIAAGAAATGALAGAAAGSAVPLVGTAVGAAAGAAVAVGASAIKKARQDDVFDPKHVHCRLRQFPAKAGEIDGSRKTATFQGFKGKYRVTYSWAVQ